jgi:hypothetical protein
MWLVMVMSMNIGTVKDLMANVLNSSHENVNHWYWPQWKNLKIV